MYNLTRQQASDILGISTRSIDRYIKSGKIRSKKDGKQVFVNKEDIKNMGGESTVTHNIIVENQDIKQDSTNIKIEKNHSSEGIVRKSDYDKILMTFEKMYSGFREEIKQKDQKIQELSLELGKIQEKSNNSVDLMEYKKIQFINEQDKKNINEKLINEKKEKDNIEKDLKYEKTTNKILIFFLIVMFIISAFIFFINL